MSNYVTFDPKFFEMLRAKAKARNLKSAPELVRQLIGYFALDREDVKAVVFQIPVSSLSSKEKLEHWLGQKSKSILKQFFPEKM